MQFEAIGVTAGAVRARPDEHRERAGDLAAFGGGSNPVGKGWTPPTGCA
jgi:hypothetical protein